MDNLKTRLKQYEFFKNMDFELEPLLFKAHAEGKIYLVKNVRSGEKFKLRLKHPNFPDTVKKERRVLRYMEQFPGHELFPRVLFTDGADELLVTDYFEGKTLKECSDFSVAEKAKILHNIDEQLKVLHSMHCRVKDLVNDIEFSDWYEWLKIIFDSYIGKLKENNLLAADDEAVIYQFFELNKPYLKNVKTSVIHGDLKPANVIWNPESGRAGLIDFESGKIGDPNFDYYRLYCDGWGFEEKYEENPVYVLYFLNTYLRWAVYAFCKKNIVEPRALEGLSRGLKLAVRLLGKL